MFNNLLSNITGSAGDSRNASHSRNRHHNTAPDIEMGAPPTGSPNRNPNFAAGLIQSVVESVNLASNPSNHCDLESGIPAVPDAHPTAVHASAPITVQSHTYPPSAPVTSKPNPATNEPLALPLPVFLDSDSHMDAMVATVGPNPVPHTSEPSAPVCLTSDSQMGNPELPNPKPTDMVFKFIMPPMPEKRHRESNLSESEGGPPSVSHPQYIYPMHSRQI